MSTTNQTSLKIRRASERFHSNHGWLDSYHTFSFGEHDDPAHRGFESLRVINDDTVAPNQGFGEHPHAGVEIISYVLSGQLQHQDSMGNGRVIRAGEFQYMSAGSGVRHSEYNPSATEPVHFLQIWIMPREKQTTPRYEERSINNLADGAALTLVASPDGREQSMAIHQEVDLFYGRVPAGEEISFPGEAPKHWIQVMKGELKVQKETLQPGDGAGIQGDLGPLQATAHSEFLLFSFL